MNTFEKELDDSKHINRTNKKDIHHYKFETTASIVLAEMDHQIQYN